MEDIVIHKIYRLFGAGMNYYGSTNQPLYERKANHKSHYKIWKSKGGWKCGSYDILDACEDWDIEIIEILPVNSSKEEVLNREKWWITNNECVNKNSPLQTAEELKEYKRQWAEKNRREKGIPVREVHIITKEEKHKNRQEYLTNLSQEEKERRLKLRRDNRKELTEEQKEKARERARKQRENNH